MKKTLRFYVGILIFSIIISLPLLIPYFHSGYFPTHDGEWAVVRLSDMFREVKDFQIPPRFSGNLNFGYGYPLFNFAYPFPYYLGLVIHLLGFGFISSIKIVFALTIPVSAFFMFLASRNIWKNDSAGIISSVLYLYFPYRLVDLFVRGSIGESVAFALFPMILYCLSKLVDKPKSVGYFLSGGILFGCLILTHNIMSVLFSITIFIFFIAFYINERNKIVKPFISTIILGFVLSAFFWIPALFEKKYISLSRVPIADRNLYFVSFKSLLFSKWGYGVPNDPVNGLTFQIGWPFIGVYLSSLFTVVYSFYKKIKVRKELNIALVLLVGIFLFSFLLFSFSKPIWKLPLLSELNFPWIVLSQLSFLIAVLGGFLAIFKGTRYLGILIAIAAIVLYLPYAKPERYLDRDDGFYITNDATTTSSNELMPIWVKQIPLLKPSEKVEVITGAGNVNILEQNSKKIILNSNFSEDSTIRVNTIYYPGWEFETSNQNLEIDYSNPKGVMDLKVPAGEHVIQGKISETPLRKAANLITLAGIIFVIIVIFRQYLFKYFKKSHKPSA